MARLKVDSIRNRNDDGPPSLIKGASIPSGGLLDVTGNISITGVSTVGFLTAQNATVGVVTALGGFVGDGSELTSLSVVTPAKAYALRNLLDPLPFRS
tara:strand:- start:745 stop:1038 length:294 start_codon:yes stop_codon:yes gene_type:complete